MLDLFFQSLAGGILLTLSLLVARSVARQRRRRPVVARVGHDEALHCIRRLP
jgi:hypothetical protein